MWSLHTISIVVLLFIVSCQLLMAPSCPSVPTRGALSGVGAPQLSAQPPLSVPSCPPPQSKPSCPSPPPPSTALAPPTGTLTALKASFSAHLLAEKGARGMNALGLADVTTLLPLLVRFITPGTPQLAIDIGANVGDTTSYFHALFTGAACRKWRGGHTIANINEPCRSSVKVLSYEPLPANFAAITARAKEEAWDMVGWRGFNVALTSADMVPAR